MHGAFGDDGSNLCLCLLALFALEAVLLLGRSVHVLVLVRCTDPFPRPLLLRGYRLLVRVAVARRDGLL